MSALLTPREEGAQRVVTPAIPAFDPDAPLAPRTTLIEASAGTGKTYTITTLVLKLLIEEGLAIGEVLVVTFTEAATAELRDRVRARLRAALLAYQGEQSAGDPWLAAFVTGRVAAGLGAEDTARVQAALAEFDQATIATIHGFCMRMLQENAFESGVRFDAELVTSMSELLGDVAADFWTSHMSGLKEDLFRYLSATKTGQPHLKITPESTHTLASLATSGGDVPLLPARPVRVGRTKASDFKAAVAEVCSTWSAARAEVCALLEAARDEGAFKKGFAEGLESAFADLDRWLARPPKALSFALQDSPAMRLSLSGLAGGKNGRKKRLQLPEHALFEALEEVGELLADYEATLERRAVNLNLTLVDYAREQLEARKQAFGLQSFDDLLVLLCSALQSEQSGERLADAIRERFKAALIDEFQDTSPVQFTIFSKVFEGTSTYLYLIGDPKQAIYGFRAADVYAYLRAAARVAPGDRVTLETNWRSDAGLVQALGHVYSAERHPDPFADERIRFVQVGSAKPDRLTSSGAPLAPLRIRLADTPNKDRYDKTELRDLLARTVPDDVARLLDQGLKIDGRDVRPGDVAILVRTNAQALRLQQELRRRRIPSVLHGSSSVFDSGEALELRLVLRAILEPSRVSAVRTALATELLGLRAAELAQLVEDPLGGADEGRIGWDARVESFRSLRTLWNERGFVQAFRSVLESYGVQERILTRVGGERSMTNLLHLSELLHRAASEERLGPEGLYRWFERQISDESTRSTSDAIKLRLESDAQALTLITIHKSKGLEYPVVFCPYLWDGGLLSTSEKTYVRFHDPDQGERLTLDVGSDQDPALDPEAEFAGRERSVALAEYESHAENARLLYVALTRARHHCSLYFGAVRDGETSPLGQLLLGGGAGAGNGATPSERSRRRVEGATARIKAMGHEQVREELEALAESAPALIEVAPIDPRAFAPTFAPELKQAEHLAPRQATLAVDWNWRSTSFSGLSAQREGEGHELHDAVESASPASRDDGDPIRLRAFPKGARVGSCLHKILELAEFDALGDREGLELVRKQLEVYGLHKPHWPALVQSALVEALETPLGGGAPRLADVSRARRMDELEFVFPVAGGIDRSGPAVSVEALAAIFERHGGPATQAYAAQLRTLGFRPLQGFLSGFMDLVFEWEGRFFLADYKSNFLGETFAAYGPDDMQRAMLEHHYVLQYHLYTVALHRFLRWRVPDYAYETHMGGVHYLFVRGMSPESPGTGVFHDRPSRALVEALDALLGGAV